MIDDFQAVAPKATLLFLQPKQSDPHAINPTLQHSTGYVGFPIISKSINREYNYYPLRFGIIRVLQMRILNYKELIQIYGVSGK